MEGDKPGQRGDYFEALGQAFDLQRKAGQQEQRERAKSNLPPRTMLRALANYRKPGRKGKKARARVERVMRRRVPEAFK